MPPQEDRIPSRKSPEEDKQPSSWTHEANEVNEANGVNGTNGTNGTNGVQGQMAMVAEPSFDPGREFLVQLLNPGTTPERRRQLMME